ncbi:aldo/keto reductase [Oceanobacillus polygoni]|uniref:aldo/keto reductase n=1 Tax=Oceanobacillus polygoni TaxID=1235259 RepID=UPI001AE59839
MYLTNTATVKNEKLVGKELSPIRDNVVLATKLFIDRETEANSIDHLEQSIRKHLEASLEGLGTDYVDLYY